MLTFILLLFFQYVHYRTNPFVTKRLNNLENISIISSIVSSINGIYVHFEEVVVESKISHFLSAISVIGIILFYIIAFMLITMEYKRKDKNNTTTSKKSEIFEIELKKYSHTSDTSFNGVI